MNYFIKFTLNIRSTAGVTNTTETFEVQRNLVKSLSYIPPLKL